MIATVKQLFIADWHHIKDQIKHWSHPHRWFTGLSFTLSIIVTIIGVVQSGFSLASLMSILGAIGIWGIAFTTKTNFFFNGAQNLTGIFVGMQSRIYGDALTSLFYLVSEFFGWQQWTIHRNPDGSLRIETRENWLLLAFAILFCGVFLGFVSWLLGGEHIVLDAITNSISFLAQIYQMARRRSAYYLWLAVDLFSIWLWALTGQWAVVAMYLAFVIQGLAGLWNWHSLGEEQSLQEEVTNE
ncbi:MAG: nicotinamide riboside transporter PnuC [Aerococcus sp.]|nr:nicotinamide riboside transporter PnuC [Aerococcus sp.]